MWSEQADLTLADICADLESGDPIVKVEVLQGDVKTDLFGIFRCLSKRGVETEQAIQIVYAHF